VLSGLTATGDPIVMDPAAPSDSTVRRVYNRAQFERAWLGGSGRRRAFRGFLHTAHPPRYDISTRSPEAVRLRSSE